MFESYGEILTIDEVCDILLIGRGRVYELLKSGEIPSFRIGDIWKIPKRGVEQYIVERSGLRKINKKE